MRSCEKFGSYCFRVLDNSQIILLMSVTGRIEALNPFVIREMNLQFEIDFSLDRMKDVSEIYR
jgi:hypothetical protein